jgi:NAD(P)-dependent dehydrogenase (short-subunit alcohol dehydrogenase family)
VKSLRERVAVVTGAGSGIGRALAELLAAEGAQLALVDRDPGALATTLRSVQELGARASVHEADVAVRERMLRLPEEVLAAHGGHVHLLVNNAGVHVASPFAVQELDELERVLRVNLLGVVYGCHAFLPHLSREPEAHIVNLSSLAGLVALPGQTAYCASKFAVHGFSECLGAELASSPVGVTTVYPGTVRTNILRASRFSDAGIQEKLSGLMARHGIPPEVAAARIVRAVQRAEPRLVIGADAWLMAGLGRLWPGFSRAAIGRLYRRLGFAG